MPSRVRSNCTGYCARQSRHSGGRTRICSRQGRSAVLGAEPHWMSVSSGRTTQNSFPSGSARTVQDSAPAWPMSTRRARAREGGQSPDRDPRRCWSGQRYTRFLSILGSVTGMKHMPTGAFSSAPMTTSFSRSDRTFQPSARVQNRPGQDRAQHLPHDSSLPHRRRLGSDPVCPSGGLYPGKGRLAPRYRDGGRPRLGV